MKKRGEGGGRNREKDWCWDEEGRRRKKGESFGTRRNHSKRCMLRLAVSVGRLQLSNTWLCQPVAQTWLCQPAVSMVNATYQHMLRLAVSSGNA